MNYSPLCPLSLCTLLLVQGTMLSASILKKKIRYSQSSFLPDNYYKFKFFWIFCKQILNTTSKAHGPFWFFHLAKRDDAKGNLTCFLLFRTLCCQIYAEAFASLQRPRASFMLCGSWEATLQLAGPALSFSLESQGSRSRPEVPGAELHPPTLRSVYVCLCNSAANPAMWAGRVLMKGYTGRHFSFPKLDLFFK